MAKQYITNGINTSTTRVGVAAEDMENVAGKAVKLNSDGLLGICNTKGEMPIGIVTIDNEADVSKGDNVTYQIFAVGIAAGSRAGFFFKPCRHRPNAGGRARR